MRVRCSDLDFALTRARPKGNESRGGRRGGSAARGSCAVVSSPGSDRKRSPRPSGNGTSTTYHTMTSLAEHRETPSRPWPAGSRRTCPTNRARSRRPIDHRRRARDHRCGRVARRDVRDREHFGVPRRIEEQRKRIALARARVAHAVRRRSVHDRPSCVRACRRGSRRTRRESVAPRPNRRDCALRDRRPSSCARIVIRP